MYLIVIYKNVIEKFFKKFQEICSQPVDLYIGQRLSHFAVYRTKKLLKNKFTNTNSPEIEKDTLIYFK